MTPQPIISIVVPCYNESKSLDSMHQEVSRVMADTSYHYEILYVDDGSEDDTVIQLARLAADDSRVRVLQLSRNFGKEVALTAGMNMARGDAVITMDADLQHPPRYIPEFLAEWDRGAEVVVGVREGRSGQSPLKRLASSIYYRIINSIAEYKVVPGSTDYRLLDREVVQAFAQFTERNRITRGLVDWLGFKRSYLYFTADIRAQGQATYSLRKLVKLALDSVVSTTLFPLKLAGYLGMFITFVAALSGLVIVIDKSFNDPLGENFTGTALLTIFVVFLVGIILSCLGLIALYIANIHTEVINRPLYVLRDNAPRGHEPVARAALRNPVTTQAAVSDRSTT